MGLFIVICLFVVTCALYKGEWVMSIYCDMCTCIKENGSCLFIVTYALYKGEWVMSICCDMCTV